MEDILRWVLGYPASTEPAEPGETQSKALDRSKSSSSGEDGRGVVATAPGSRYGRQSKRTRAAGAATTGANKNGQSKGSAAPPTAPRPGRDATNNKNVEELQNSPPAVRGDKINASEHRAYMKEQHNWGEDTLDPRRRLSSHATLFACCCCAILVCGLAVGMLVVWYEATKGTTNTTSSSTSSTEVDQTAGDSALAAAAEHVTDQLLLEQRGRAQHVSVLEDLFEFDLETSTTSVSTEDVFGSTGSLVLEQVTQATQTDAKTLRLIGLLAKNPYLSYYAEEMADSWLLKQWDAVLNEEINQKTAQQIKEQALQQLPSLDPEADWEKIWMLERMQQFDFIVGSFADTQVGNADVEDNKGGWTFHAQRLSNGEHKLWLKLRGTSNARDWVTNLNSQYKETAIHVEKGVGFARGFSNKLGFIGTEMRDGTAAVKTFDASIAASEVAQADRAALYPGAQQVSCCDDKLVRNTADKRDTERLAYVDNTYGIAYRAIQEYMKKHGIRFFHHVVVTGHSLGGALAQIATALRNKSRDYPDLIANQLQRDGLQNTDLRFGTKNFGAAVDTLEAIWQLAGAFADNFRSYGWAPAPALLLVSAVNPEGVAEPPSAWSKISQAFQAATGMNADAVAAEHALQDAKMNDSGSLLVQRLRREYRVGFYGEDPVPRVPCYTMMFHPEPRSALYVAADADDAAKDQLSTETGWSSDIFAVLSSAGVRKMPAPTGEVQGLAPAQPADAGAGAAPSALLLTSPASTAEQLAHRSAVAAEPPDKVDLAQPPVDVGDKTAMQPSVVLPKKRTTEEPAALPTGSPSGGPHISSAVAAPAPDPPDEASQSPAQDNASILGSSGGGTTSTQMLTTHADDASSTLSSSSYSFLASKSLKEKSARNEVEHGAPGQIAQVASGSARSQRSSSSRTRPETLLEEEFASASATSSSSAGPTTILFRLGGARFRQLSGTNCRSTPELASQGLTLTEGHVQAGTQVILQLKQLLDAAHHKHHLWQVFAELQHEIASFSGDLTERDLDAYYEALQLRETLAWLWLALWLLPITCFSCLVFCCLDGGKPEGGSPSNTWWFDAYYPPPSDSDRHKFYQDQGRGQEEKAMQTIAPSPGTDTEQRAVTLEQKNQAARHAADAWHQRTPWWQWDWGGDPYGSVRQAARRIKTACCSCCGGREESDRDVQNEKYNYHYGNYYKDQDGRGYKNNYYEGYYNKNEHVEDQHKDYRYKYNKGYENDFYDDGYDDISGYRQRGGDDENNGYNENTGRFDQYNNAGARSNRRNENFDRAYGGTSASPSRTNTPGRGTQAQQLAPGTSVQQLQTKGLEDDAHQQRAGAAPLRRATGTAAVHLHQQQQNKNFYDKDNRQIMRPQTAPHEDYSVTSSPYGKGQGAVDRDRNNYGGYDNARGGPKSFNQAPQSQQGKNRGPDYGGPRGGYDNYTNYAISGGHTTNLPRLGPIPRNLYAGEGEAHQVEEAEAAARETETHISSNLDVDEDESEKR
ncbi:unnamed protein product [Amoebophrya sp. A120]|nr:unnamed protein product [Amoebophrya sp. A120]|eukprot:GSA120T00019047001.1